MIEPDLARVVTIRTLGPPGTNCEAAAYEWFTRAGWSGRVVLHRTLEEAAERLADNDDGREALLGCVVYPDLHQLVFNNLASMTLADVFIMPTHPMVLASRDSTPPTTVATHPAPQNLVPTGIQRVLTTSNSQAAEECAAGSVDGCITTRPAAEYRGLRVVTDFGPVQMGFTIHVLAAT